uniref:Hybrid signal transduction protein dokA-like n=1 Tax=Sedum alfredii TaxID=439688 RepID=A0A8E4V0H4_9MAGN|nr:hybrid signal transduction protein dokA-like [Sedum alfredii]
MGSRTSMSMAKAKGHALPKSPSYRDVWKIKKALSDDSLMMELFKEWTRDNDRSYPTKEEEEQRFRVFKFNAQEALDRYNEGRKIWGIGVFADMSNDEFEAVFIRKGITYDSDFDVDDVISKSATTCPV